MKLLLVLTLLIGTSAIAQTKELSCKRFVNDLYHSNNAAEESYRLHVTHPELYTPGLARLLNRVDKEAEGEAGLDFVYFVGNQDPADRYLLGRVTVNGDRCRVEYFEVRDGIRSNKPAAMPELLLVGNRWKVDNIFYPDQPDLRKQAIDFLREGEAIKTKKATQKKASK